MSEMKPFSEDAIREAIQQLPPNQGGIGVVAHRGDVGVAGSVQKPLGKGWTVNAAGQWMKQTGYSVAAWIGWKGSGT